MIIEEATGHLEREIERLGAARRRRMQARLEHSTHELEICPHARCRSELPDARRRVRVADAHACTEQRAEQPAVDSHARGTCIVHDRLQRPHGRTPLRQLLEPLDHSGGRGRLQ